ncbi:MAG: wax ester/triacylglycerol synthase family O-acyltransferase [Pseudonocardiales bacterium]
MTERLTSADVSFLYLEGRTTPQHVGAIAAFAPPADGFDYDRLVRLLEERISLVPRYRQKMRAIPGHLANPVWVDDPNFDITYHVRRSALPRPGTQAQLLEFCARIQSRLLDRSRPLWEMYLVEGLADGQIAILTKTHHAMVDDLGAIDIAQVILDDSPEPLRTVEPLWMPGPEPSAAGLLVQAIAGLAHRPAAAVDAVRLGVKDIRAATEQVTAVAGTALSTALALVRRAPSSPLNVKLGQQRRLAVARTRLDDYRQVRQAHGATVNDVALATVAGALRGWLLQRGEVVAPSQAVRALVPVSVHDEEPGGAGHVMPLLVDLPVGEPNPLRRLRLIGTAMAEHQRSGRSVSADALVALSGFAPPTLHGLGARAAKGLTRRMFSLVVTNVPGPQLPLYAAGARMTEMFPILPLGPGQAVSVGITSYDGGVFYGVNGDRDAMPDVDVLAALIEESLAELVEASPVATERHTAVAALGRVGRRKPGSRRPVARAPRGSQS